MRYLHLLFLLFISSSLFAQNQRPNVILIYTDDQGSIDMNCYGAKDLTTPHMDALAERGVRFTQFYAAAPVCSPSRAGLLTGKVPQRAGLPGNASSSEGHAGMPAEQITIAEMLKEAGYATGHVGKWHLGYTPETMPNGQGFDYSFGHMGGCIDNYSHFFYWNGPNRHDLWQNGEEIFRDGQFFPDLMVEEASNFIEEHQKEPFFLYWAINTPHYPLQGEEKWRAHYKNLPSPRREYAAFVSTTDEKIGELVAKVDELGLRKNTIIILMSDHGHSTEERTFGGGGNAGPYRGAKFSLFEGGIRVPAIISWPGQLPENEVREQMGVGVDWYPTIAELCKVSPNQDDLDGSSIVSVILSVDAPSPHETFHWATGREQWAVRQGDWKLIGNPYDPTEKAPLPEGQKYFLVNLAEDISEMNNLEARHPEKVKEMEKLHHEWIKQLPQH
ncbi:sulfatase-like hydrolase/transferase [Catalinimonas niigatensis]|uniref:sulfatase-like hydrolase/transferase n=1 Tax=Catalinimonas niigatensis TaxID=1397264 RepID=UPI002665C71E|nr:sulfatase-like hydrolase/transferase [Catalinimonas niigatensis]WPP51602.1 sulfatase-like hydrolase/transferase [Catalinimonas niigatensis]